MRNGRKQILIVAEISADGPPHASTLAGFTFAKRLSRCVEADCYLYATGSTHLVAQSELRQLGALGCFYCPIERAPSLPEQLAPTLCHLIQHHPFDYVISAATCFGKDLLPRLAGMLGSAYVGDCTDVQSIASVPVFLRPVHAGFATAHCVTTSRVVLVTARTTEFEAAPAEDPPCPIVEVAELVAPWSRIRQLGLESAVQDRPCLSEARVVVSGGRPLGCRFFELLAPLADVCQGALGATRALCDAGHVPYELQVGQTGKLVAPELYFAVGISGSVQHLAGMRGSRTIVAINSDADAPIFSHADIGIVADMWQVVPQLVASIAERHHRAC